jgi:L-asparaginase
MNQYINSARDVTKTETTNVQTFTSGKKGYLGYIANGKVIRFNDRGSRQKLPLPEKLPEVVLLTTYAGDKGELIRYAADSGAKGIVIEGLGAGNVNLPTFEAIRYAISKGIPVVISTRVHNGRVYSLYGDQGGGKTLEDAGAILAGDLKGPKARILLMLALPVIEKNHCNLKDFF